MDRDTAISVFSRALDSISFNPCDNCRTDKRGHKPCDNGYKCSRINEESFFAGGNEYVSRLCY